MSNQHFLDLEAERAELGPNAELLRLYRRHANEMPSAALDERVLAMAAAAAGPVRSAQRPRSLRWLSMAASAAIVVLGAGFAWRMHLNNPLPQSAVVESAKGKAIADDAPTPQAAAAPIVTTTAAAPAAAPGATGAGPGVLPDTGSTQRSLESETAAPASPLARPNEPQTSFEPSTGASGAAARASEATSDPTLLSTPASDSSISPGKPDAEMTPPAAAPAPAPVEMAAEAVAPVDGAKTLARRSPLDPQVWLASILDLLNAGHADEARVSLREWRLRFPRSDVPTELQPLLDPADPAWRAPEAQR